MKNLMKLDDDKLYTRGELRELGLNYCSMQFLRWEKAGLLTAHKPQGLRSARVHYLGRQANELFRLRAA